MCTLSELTAYYPLYSVLSYSLYRSIEFNFSSNVKINSLVSNCIIIGVFKNKMILSLFLNILLYLPIIIIWYKTKHRTCLYCRMFLLSDEKTVINIRLLYYNFLSVFLVLNWTVPIYIVLILCYWSVSTVCAVLLKSSLSSSKE